MVEKNASIKDVRAEGGLGIKMRTKAENGEWVDFTVYLGTLDDPL